MINEKMIPYIEKAMQGDNEAFVKVCEMKGRDILYVCIRLMNNQYDGEAVASEVIRKMHATITTELQEVDGFDVWLYHIIREMCELWRQKREVFIYSVLKNDD